MRTQSAVFFPFLLVQIPFDIVNKLNVVEAVEQLILLCQGELIRCFLESEKLPWFKKTGGGETYRDGYKDREK